MKFIIKLKGTVLCLFILFITGTGCDSRIAITEGKQSRTENCGRGFDTWQASNETAAYVIEKTVAADEESARDLVRNMEEKRKKLFDYLPGSAEKPVTVWVVEQDINGTGAVMYPYVMEDVIITGKEQAEDGTFLAAVVEEATESSRWTAYGAAAAALGREGNQAGNPEGNQAGDQEENQAENQEESQAGDQGQEKELAEYYSDTEDMGILGLSDLRFSPQLCTEQEIQTARKTAEAFYCYLEEREGREEAWRVANRPGEEALARVKQEWLHSIGVDKEYDYPYSGLEEYKIKDYAAGRKNIVITGPYADYDIALKKEPAYLMSNARNVERFLYNSQNGIEKIRSWMQEADNADQLLLNRRAKYQINENQGKEAGGWTDINTGTIVLDTPAVLASHLHELIHVWTSEDSGLYDNSQADLWLSEGFASYGAAQAQEYCSMDIGGYEDIDINCFRAIELDKGNAGVLTGIVSLNKKKEAAEKIRSRYQEAGGSVEPKEFNHGLFQDILAAAMIQEDGIEPITGRNEYPLYESFVKYLAERYSTEQVIDAVTKEKSIEEAFGKHFQELQQEWITKISQKGGVAK